MSTNSFPKWIMTGLFGLGVLVATASAIIPAMAQGYGRDNQNGRSGNGRNNNNWNNNGNNGRVGSNRDNRDGYGRSQNRNIQTTWSEIDRKPDFNTNDRPGCYVWREGNDVFVVSNDRNWTRASHYSGQIQVQNRSFSNIGAYQTEGRDCIRQVLADRLQFNFTTDNGLDGVRFHVNDGRRIILTLETQGRGQDRIYLGRNKTEIIGSRLVIQK